MTRKYFAFCAKSYIQLKFSYGQRSKWADLLNSYE